MADNNYYTDSSYAGSYTDSKYNEYGENLNANDLPVTKQDKLIYTADIYIETKNYANTYTSIF